MIIRRRSFCLTWHVSEIVPNHIRTCPGANVSNTNNSRTIRLLNIFLFLLLPFWSFAIDTSLFHWSSLLCARFKALVPGPLYISSDYIWPSLLVSIVRAILFSAVHTSARPLRSRSSYIHLHSSIGYIFSIQLFVCPNPSIQVRPVQFAHNVLLSKTIQHVLILCRRRRHGCSFSLWFWFDSAFDLNGRDATKKRPFPVICIGPGRPLNVSRARWKQ